MKGAAPENDSGAFVAALVRLLAVAGKPEHAANQDEIAVRLPALLTRRAQSLEGADPDGALVANKDHPGYLTRLVDGVAIHAPWPIAPFFPGEATARDLMRLADEVSVDPNGSVCISGSGAFLGGLRRCGDLDYCEYVFDGMALPPAVTARAARQTERAVLITVKCEGGTDIHPWTDLNARLEAFAGRGLPFGEATRRLKLDYCVLTDGRGPLPASNVVLWLDREKPETGNGFASFAHQEAVIDRGQGIARTLIAAPRLAAYLLFLLTQMTDLIDEKPFKALKRTLSLCGMLGLTDQYEDMLQLLNHPATALKTRLDGLAEFETWALEATPAERTRLLDALDWERDAIGAGHVEPEDRSQIEDAIRAVVRGLSDRVRLMISVMESDDGSN